jgi:THUMP domain-like
LTGDHMLLSPFVQPFHVLDVSPLDQKQLKRLLTRNRIGTLEIKVRGLNVAPETLRRQLDLSGDRTATLLLVGGTGPARAVLAQRASTGGSITSSAGGAAGACDSASGAAPLPLSSD